MEIVISIAAKISEYLVAPIGRQAGYLICYNSNMRTLKTQVEKLCHIKSRVQHSVDAAKNNGECIEADVDSWLTTVNEINLQVERIFEDEAKVNKGCLRGWCPDLSSRYLLSRKVKKKTQVVVELQGEGLFQRVSYLAHPLGIEYMATRGFVDFESRNSIMEEIMAALKDDNINAIGICGLGGIGKTTTVKEVGKKSKAEKLFDEIVMAVITQTPDLKKIQGEIADMLGLKFDEESLSGRARRLCARLMDKRVLVILDDVWERLDLEAVGIPFGGDRKGCKVMLTSRNQDVCKEMKTQKNFTIGVLSKLEAWNLFKEMAGNSIDSSDLHLIAEQVVNECGGLPIAIVTVGRALENKSKHMWSDALRQLKMSNPKNISRMETNVYRSLELSYDLLESQEAKSCLLLCCVFEEDANIPVEDLVIYGMGLGLFKGIDALVEARDRVYTLVDKLKSCYLLLNGSSEEYAKMHDVVRDVIRSIAIEGKDAFMLRHGLELKEWPTKGMDKQYTSISLISNKIHKLLLLTCMDDSLEAPDILFEGMKELKVLDLRRMFIPSPPPSLSFLTQLQTLRIERCKLQDISVIGELNTLIILSFRGSSIKELPREIGKLTHLRLLDLTNCDSLQIISPGVISSLIRLEELYMGNSFVQWEVEEEGKEKNNVNLAELLSLSHLTALETHLPTAKFSGGNFPFENLVRFKISIGIGADWYLRHQNQSQTQLALNLDARIPVQSGINALVKKTESLHLEVKGVKNVLNDLTQECFIHLKSLSLFSCDEQEYLIDTMDLVPHRIFPVLESLSINFANNLKMICHGQLPAGSFGELRELYLGHIPELMHLWKGPTQLVSLGNLRNIQLNGCERLENVFLQSIARGLVQLEDLKIHDCKMIEEIVATEREHGKATSCKIRFPKLTHLSLYELPSITGFCKKMDEIEFPQLSTLRLEDLPKLMSFCPNSLASKGNHDTATQHLFNEKVTIPSVEELKLVGTNNVERIVHGQLLAGSLHKLRVIRVLMCKKLLNVIPSNFPQMSQNLEELFIHTCDSLVEVFEIEGLNVEERDIVQLSKLKQLTLRYLPKLKHIWKREPKGILCLQSLSVLIVDNCNSLRNLFSPSTARSVVKLQDLNIIECEMMTEIVAEDKGEEDEKAMDKIEFPQLRRLILQCVPNLMSFFPKVNITASNMQHLFNEKVAFPSLETLKLYKLNNLNEIWCSQLPKVMQICKMDLKGTMGFQNLKWLSVIGCGSLRNLFYPSIARGLVHLEELFIGNCVMMEEIVAKGEEGEEERMDEIQIPQLKSLELHFLPNLTSFCQGRFAFDLPSLEKVIVNDCLKMKTFSPGFLSTPKLEKVETRPQSFWMGDLNNTIQLLFVITEMEVNQEIRPQEQFDDDDDDDDEDNFPNSR